VSSRYSTVKIDEARMYSRILSDSEIKALADFPPAGIKITPMESITISDASATNITRYQTSDNTYVTATVNTATAVDGVSRRHLKLISYPQDKLPKSDAVFVFGKSGSFSKKFRAMATTRNKSDEIEISAIEHISSLYSSEPTITVIDENISTLPNPLLKPDPPINVSVTPNLWHEGLGFTLYAEPPINVMGIKEITVKIKRETEDEGSYEIIATMPNGTNSVKYNNSALEMDVVYTFRFTCSTQFKTSDPVDVTSELSSSTFRLDPPSGLRVQGLSPNTNTFDSKDITIEWNPVIYTEILGGYKVSVMTMTLNSSGNETFSLLRESFVTDEKYTYTFDNMMEDTGGTIYGVSSNKLYFFVHSLNSKGIPSTRSAKLPLYNDVPDPITSLSSSPIVGGVKFVWANSAELDHKTYQYCTKINGDSWTTATNITENSLSKYMTSSEITTYGNSPTMYIRVKDLDWYKQASATYLITSASSNTLADSIFQLSVRKSSGITGTNSDLYDNTLSSGGVTVT
jgi:hypothetical protein